MKKLYIEEEVKTLTEGYCQNCMVSSKVVNVSPDKCKCNCHIKSRGHLLGSEGCCPKGKIYQPLIRSNFTIEPSLFEWVKFVSQRLGYSHSQVVNMALKEFKLKKKVWL
jgi:hypothetical protein